MNLIVSYTAEAIDKQRTELCEHKGDGHPDSLCDGIAEAVSQALCGAYLRAYGELRHHNVDKILLVGGRSLARFRHWHRGGERYVLRCRPCTVFQA